MKRPAMASERRRISELSLKGAPTIARRKPRRKQDTGQDRRRRIAARNAACARATGYAAPKGITGRVRPCNDGRIGASERWSCCSGRQTGDPSGWLIVPRKGVFFRMQTRRTFPDATSSRPSGVGSIATAVVAGVRDAEAQGPAAVGPGDVPITLTINGQRHQLQRRAARHAARCDAHSTRDHRTEARVRSRRVRRVHGHHRRPHLLLVLDARDRGAGQEHPHRRWPRRKARRSIRCSRRSATTTA